MLIINRYNLTINLAKYVWIISSFILMYCFIGENKVCAEGISNYTVQLLLPNHQNKEVTSYFDMCLQPNESDKIGIEINNQENHAQHFQIAFTNATTNDNGIVDYTKKNVELVGDASIDFLQTVDKENYQLEVASNSKKVMWFNVHMPNKQVAGIILGGVQVSNVNHDTQKQVLNHEVQYTAAIKLSQNNEPIVPKLKALSAKVDTIDDHQVVKMTIQNLTPVLLRKAEIRSRFYKEGDKTPLIDERKKGLSIAPNSEFNLFSPIVEAVKPGDYRYDIVIKNALGEWHLSKKVTITHAKAQEINKDYPRTPQSNEKLLIAAITCLSIILLLLVIKMMKVVKDR
ncbi:DUF916 and DUF3324 domain-containing protein [Vagococcus xieshaowenii]